MASEADRALEVVLATADANTVKAAFVLIACGPSDYGTGISRRLLYKLETRLEQFDPQFYRIGDERKKSWRALLRFADELERAQSNRR